MTSYTSIAQSSCGSTTARLTADRRQALNNDVEKRKAILRVEYEEKKRGFADKLKETEQRVIELARRRKVEKLEKIAKNRERFEKVKKNIDAINMAQVYRKIKLTETFNNRDRKTMKQIAKTREIEETKKREKQMRQYLTMVEKQHQELKENAEMIDRCVLNPHLHYEEEPEEIKEEIEEKIEEKSSEQCLYLQRPKNMPGVDRELRDYEDRVKIMERIENLKMKFNTCDQGVAFWEKTAPLWDRMTLCLKDTLAEVKNEGHDHVSVSVHHLHQPSLMQKIMMDDVDYNLTDKEMIEVLTSTKAMLGPNATPVEMLHLARRIVEHKAEVNSCADYMVHGLIERSIFEFVKREVTKCMFVDMRKVVDRLQHVNDPGLIPVNLIYDHNVAGVTSFVYDMIRDVESYHRFDLPLDDEPKYVQMSGPPAPTKIYEFLANHGYRFEPRTARLHPMPRKDELPQIVGKTIKRFLHEVHYNTALFLSTDHDKNLAKSAQSPRIRGPGKISMPIVIRISRKLTKFAFNMFASEQVKQSDEQAVILLYRSLVANRSPRINYFHRPRPRPEEVDMDYYLNHLKQSELAL